MRKKKRAHLSYWPPYNSVNTLFQMSRTAFVLRCHQVSSCVPSILITLREAQVKVPVGPSGSRCFAHHVLTEGVHTELALVMWQQYQHQPTGIGLTKRKEFLQKLARDAGKQTSAKADGSRTYKLPRGLGQSDGSPAIRGSLGTRVEAFAVSSAPCMVLGTPLPGLGPLLKVATQAGPRHPPIRRYHRSSRRCRH